MNATIYCLNNNRQIDIQIDRQVYRQLVRHIDNCITINLEYMNATINSLNNTRYINKDKQIARYIDRQ